MSALALLTLSVVATARAAAPAVDAVQAVLRAEERVLQAAESDRADHLARERATADELARAAARYVSLLGTTDPAERAQLPAAQAAHAAAERTLAELLAATARHEERVAASQLRLAELRAAAASVAEASPQPGPLEGRWEVRYAPTNVAGWMRLSQQGAFVTGEDALLDGRHGSVSGTHAAGRLELTRIDSAIGRDVVLVGTLNAAGQLEGTWQATVFGRGTPEAGTWRAVRMTEPAPAAAAPSSP